MHKGSSAVNHARSRYGHGGLVCTTVAGYHGMSSTQDAASITAPICSCCCCNGSGNYARTRALNEKLLFFVAVVNAVHSELRCRTQAASNALFLYAC